MLNELFTFFSNQFYNTFNIINFLICIGGITAIYGIFKFIYKKLGKEFIIVDFNISPFEKDFLNKFFWYIKWAAFQQILVLILAFLFFDNPIWAYIFSVCLFTIIYHLFNTRLMLFTFCFSLLFYFAWFFLGFKSIIYLSILHAFGGTAYYKTGWDMQVWRSPYIEKIKTVICVIFKKIKI